MNATKRQRIDPDQIRKTISLDEPTHEFIKSVEASMVEGNFSAAVRQIVRDLKDYRSSNLVPAQKA